MAWARWLYGLSIAALVACNGRSIDDARDDATGGDAGETSGMGGNVASGGASTGAAPTGGVPSTGGSMSTGGAGAVPSMGGAPPTGGSATTGGAAGTGGLPACTPQDAQFIGSCEPAPAYVFTGVECVPMVGCSCVGTNCQDLLPPLPADGDRVANPCLLTFRHCLGVPKSCEDIAATYEEYTSRNACDSDADCSIVPGHCGVGLGGCFHVINNRWPASGLDALASEWQLGRCHAPVCSCAAPPTQAMCMNGACVPAL